MYELYVDFMSQPSRALMILSRINSKSIGGKVSEKTVLIHKGQHRTKHAEGADQFERSLGIHAVMAGART